jgi:hypothetical protein
MGELINLNPASPITDAELPSTITRDNEFIAADAAHVAATDPHPTYLTQTRGDARYLRELTMTFTIDLPSMPANQLEKRFYTLTGAKVGDFALLSPINTNLFATASWPFIFVAVVEGTDTVGCYFRNDNTGAIDLASIQFRLVVLSF